jgi:hypothetical protein
MFGDYLNFGERAAERIAQGEQEAARRWRFRHLKTKEQVVLTSVLNSILGLFLR